MKLVKCLFFYGFLVVSTPLYANEAMELDAEKFPWTVGITGGVTSLKRADDQFFANISISKDIGASYVGLSVSHIDSGDVPGLIGSIPASTTEATLSAGTSLEALNLDGYRVIWNSEF